MSSNAAKALELLKNDFEFYAKTCLKIRDKTGNIIPFVLNTAQRIALAKIEEQRREHGYTRVIVLKARQQGLSTLINGLLYRETTIHKGYKTLVVAHVGQSTAALFDMTKRFHDNMPLPIKPSTRYRSKRELSFDRLDSSYLVVTAGGDDIARGETLQNGHLSEVAFWPKASAASNFNGLMKAFPPLPGTNLFIESTANGVSGVFADMWRGAVEGENGFLPIFLPWFITPEYRAPVPEGFERTYEEMELIERYGSQGLVDDEQLQWRRLEIAKNGRELFKQEYPACPEEAFLTAGSPVFHPERIEEMRATQVSDQYSRYGHIKGAGFSENSRGDLLVWDPPDPGTQYVIGADVAMGYKGGDYSVAVVLDDTRRVVARYRSHVHPAYFAEVLFDLGKFYNTARLIVENNQHGILTCNLLGQEMCYPNFYTEETVDKVTKEFKTKLGFHTNVSTKPFIIDELRAAIVERSIVIPDRLILDELSTYVVDENGKMGAEVGSDAHGEKLHDDLVMGLALANHIHVDRFTPITVTDDFYIEVP